MGAIIAPPRLIGDRRHVAGIAINDRTDFLAKILETDRLKHDMQAAPPG